MEVPCQEPFSEDVARGYLRDIIQGIEYCEFFVILAFTLTVFITCKIKTWKIVELLKYTCAFMRLDYGIPMHLPQSYMCIPEASGNTCQHQHSQDVSAVSHYAMYLLYGVVLTYSANTRCNLDVVLVTSWSYDEKLKRSLIFIDFVVELSLTDTHMHPCIHPPIHSIHLSLTCTFDIVNALEILNPRKSFGCLQCITSG